MIVVLFTEMVKIQGEAFAGAGDMICILEGLSSRTLLDMQMGFLSTYPWKEEGAEAKDVKKESSSGGEPPRRVCGPRGQEEKAFPSAVC